MIPQNCLSLYTRRLSYSLFVAALALTWVGPRHVFANYDEFQAGELSDAAGQPTKVELGISQTRISGILGGGNRDYLTFTVQPGKKISSVQLAHFNSNNDLALVAIQSGASWTAGNKTSQMLGQQLLGPDEIGRPLLGISLDRPLLPGNYTMLLQQAGGASEFTILLGYQPTISTRGNFITFRPRIAQKILVSGSSLRGDVLVKAPPGFEVSLSNYPNTWAKTATIRTPASGELPVTNLFVRLPLNSRSGFFTGNVELSSPGATTVRRSINGRIPRKR
jgi:hypothetical protein